MPMTIGLVHLVTTAADERAMVVALPLFLSGEKKYAAEEFHSPGVYFWRMKTQGHKHLSVRAHFEAKIFLKSG
jgi:hypothetical protein